MAGIQVAGGLVAILVVIAGIAITYWYVVVIAVILYLIFR